MGVLLSDLASFAGWPVISIPVTEAIQLAATAPISSLLTPAQGF